MGLPRSCDSRIYITSAVHTFYCVLLLLYLRACSVRAALVAMLVNRSVIDKLRFTAGQVKEESRASALRCAGARLITAGAAQVWQH